MLILFGNTQPNGHNKRNNACSWCCNYKLSAKNSCVFPTQKKYRNESGTIREGNRENGRGVYGAGGYTYVGKGASTIFIPFL